MLLLPILGATFDAQMISVIIGLFMWLGTSFAVWGDENEWSDIVV